MLSRALFTTSRAFASVSDVAACSTQFSDIIRSRTCCHNFIQKDVDDSLLNHILSETLTAPTARNWQPYKIVIMKDKQNIAKLAECCVKGNANVLNQAAGVAVFLADSDPVKLGDDFKALWEQEGKDGSKVAKMMSTFNRTIGKGGITGWFNELLLRVASKKMVTPIYQTGLEWSTKQTIFPLEMFVLSCQANGLATGIMEGFDGRRVRGVIGCSKRYSVSALVPFGYRDESKSSKASARYPSEKMVFNEKFGNQRTGISTLQREG